MTSPLSRLSPLSIVLAASLAGALVAVGLLSAAAKGANVSLALTIDQRPRAATPEYAYDGYYALRASELFADTLISWFGTPSFVSEMYAEAGEPAPADAVREARRFRAKKYSSQSVVVAFSSADHAAAVRLAGAAAAVAERRAARLNLDDRGASLFVVESDPPIVTPAGLPPEHSAIVGLLAGAAAGFLLAFLARPRNPENAKSSQA